MRVKKLTLQAFLSYRQQQTLDFCELGDHRLFLIHGDTGAGKTTILDAICFALYGKASNGDRHQQSGFRSAKATDDQATFVELIFELSGQTYRVFRQLAHIRQGRKTATGEALEFSVWQNEQFVALADKMTASDVTKLIAETVGLSYEQFCKIVMLPQGEFAKLLTSKSDEKEKILRKIFATDTFLQIVGELDQRQKAAAERVKIAQRWLDEQWAGLKLLNGFRDGSALIELFQSLTYHVPHVLTALADEQTYAEEQLLQTTRAVEQTEQQWQAALKQFNEAEATEQQFKDLEQKINDWRGLEAQASEMTLIDSQITKAEQAAGCMAAEQFYAQALQDLKVAKAEADERIADEQLAAGARDVAKAAVEQARLDEQERLRLGADLQRFEDMRPQMLKYADEQANMARLSAEQVEAEQGLQTLTDELEKQEQRLQVLRATVEEAERVASPLTDIVEQSNQWNMRRTQLQDVLRLHEKVNHHQQQVEQLHEQYERQHQLHAEMEVRWIAEYAGTIAQHLHDGDACPVCGSEQHPVKAQMSEGAPSREAIEQAAEAKATAYADYAAEQRMLTETATSLEEQIQLALEAGLRTEQLVQQIQMLDDELATLQTQMTIAREAHNTLQTSKTLLHPLENHVRDRQQAHKLLDKNWHDLRLQVESARRALALYREQFAEDVQTIDQLDERIAQMAAEKHALDERWHRAESALQQASDTYKQAHTLAEEGKKGLLAKEQRERQTFADLQDAFVQAGFTSIESYEQAKIVSPVLKQLQEQVRDYRESCATTQAVIASLEKQLAGKTRPVLSELENAVTRYAESLRELREQLLHWNHLRDKLSEAQSAFIIHYTEWESAQRAFAVVKQLHDYLNGQNKEKVTFERFLQMEYLDRIVEAANERLQTLVNGQFFLARSGKRRKHGGQSGLDFDIYDLYTEEYRPAQTLSGGEKFNASLCLALGLADTIQAYGGGVAIDMMFIDEGFGSLDQESLLRAHDTLTTLQESGRMLAVISHLKEMHDLIPAKLQVSKLQDGSSRAQFKF
jgi:exonuclease SbcC